MAADELDLTTHGGITPRGLEAVPKSPLFEGRFGRMFRALPIPSHADAALRALGEALPEESNVGAAADNPAIPSAYTYFGQFVDHDITFDPVSQLQRVNDPDALVDFRTPRFDLDSVYGAGPSASPFLYESRDPVFGGVKLLVGRNPPNDPLQGGDPLDPQDLPRNEQGRALIGDPRNDENIIVSQLQLAFLKFHDRAADRVRRATRLNGAALFQETRRLVTWHYQWVVIHDFLERVVGPELVRDVLVRGRRFFDWENTPFMPVEFSAAAYRFGHSMVRPDYDLNETVTGVQIFARAARPGTFESLHGFRRLPSLWTIDWSHFAPLTRRRPQPSRKINIRLAPPLMRLPTSVDAGRNPLAVLNLLRGRALQLPSGQAVAGAMRLRPLTTAQLAFGRLRLAAAHRRAFELETPLWFYVLREAEVFGRSQRLGPVGGRIVAEVLIGLLEGDPSGFLKAEPDWRPGRGAVAFPAARRGDFTLSDLLRFATT
ncbi:heme peroxidase family protein [Conexibacter stalactiti]|uniref:Heme peroxidase family protein n=1 Tax=Conexibacter stalactiti TaxID=1940611 RepID=A0ABU4HHJ3_9ACTN|nr:heme peroxidase family protein [Conexibacter stalactiti]MDW5592772.1 heme peroxidase family protein [Conexibacter stalactiti]MEC5033413.1 heme peroxidase family protein [Conexibacter stalactiti]